MRYLGDLLSACSFYETSVDPNRIGGMLLGNPKPTFIFLRFVGIRLARGNVQVPEVSMLKFQLQFVLFFSPIDLLQKLFLDREITLCM